MTLTPISFIKVDVLQMAAPDGMASEIHALFRRRIGQPRIRRILSSSRGGQGLRLPAGAFGLCGCSGLSPAGASAASSWRPARPGISFIPLDFLQFTQSCLILSSFSLMASLSFCDRSLPSILLNGLDDLFPVSRHIHRHLALERQIPFQPGRWAGAHR